MRSETQAAFAFSGKSAVYEAVMKSLRDFLETEVELTLMQETQGESRAFSAGRASSLVDLKNHLEWCRQEALNQAEQI
tara:strand:+ start:89 stop:322 length:234 start_codon:yes stop_codon:yes gene_type:complete